MIYLDGTSEKITIPDHSSIRSPETISFDHDLGTGKTGDDFAKWLIDQHLDGMFKFKSNFKFLVHSANPVGSVNIRKRLDNFLKYIK